MGTKVLVAHGSTRALKQAVQELQLAGCEVIATPDGGDAFARFFEDQPEVVICSANLPSLSGINFARMVTAQSPETHVAILSTQSIYDVPNGAFVLGEPLSIADLRRVLPGLFSDSGSSSVGSELRTPVFVQAVLRRFEKDSDLLTALGDDGLHKLASVAAHKNCQDGELIIRQGDRGDGFYLVVEGQVRVTLAEKDDAQVARIGPGGFFGEMSLLNEQPRSASVWSMGGSTVLFFEKTRVQPILEDYPQVREVLSGVALKRTEDNLWSVLFDESEVDQTLEELEMSLRSPPPQPAPMQATTTARFVERGEKLPSNEPEPEPQPEPELSETRTPARVEPSRRAEKLRPPADRAPARSRSSMPAFALGSAVGFGMGLAAALVLIPMALKHTSLEPKAKPVSGTETGTGTESESESESESAIETEPDRTPIPDFSVEERPLTPAQDAQRKTIRKRMFAAVSNQAWGLAQRLGERLQKEFRLDWEAQLKLAEAQRMLGFQEAAIATYRHFVATYPTNVFAGNARFWLAELYSKRGDHERAKRLYGRLVADSKSEFADRARQRLERFPKSKETDRR